MINVQSFNNKRDIYHSDDPKALVVLAHGAGAGNQHDFIKGIATQLCESGFTVSAMNFPYMEQAYDLNKKRPPNRAPLLLESIEQELDFLQKNIDSTLDIFIVGKSMGGRMATVFAADDEMIKNVTNKLKGVVALGYPFHPPGKVDKLQERIAHFENLSVPMLIIQGERDTFGNQGLVAQTASLNDINIHWITDGDHSFKPKKSAPVTESENIDTACKETIQFMLDKL